MKALVFDGASPGQPALQLVADYPQPHPAPGEACIRVVLAGICNTDLEVVQGYAGFQGVLGHEFVGIVEQAGNPSLIGQRVVGEINAACGQCETCRAGRRTHCPHRTALGIRGRDGVLAQYCTLPEANLHLVPEGVPDKAAVFTEPLAAACQILEQVHVHPTDRVIVLGDGKLGLLVAQVMALTGCDLVAVGRHESKLAILSARGVRTQIGDQGLANQADIVIECTGHPEGFGTARRLLRPQGILVLKSTIHGPVQVDLSSLAVEEIEVIGSRCGPFKAALRLLAAGYVQVMPLIEAEYPLDQGLAAFEHAARRGALKVLIRP